MKITFIRPNMFARKANDAMEPLVFAVLKSLTPDDIELELYDDRIEEIPEYIDTDIIAMTVETFTARRAYQLADKFRNKGIKVVMGGYHPTFLPTESLEHADSIFVGEAEGSWHLFLEDVRKGYLQKIYQQPKNISITNIEFDESIFANKSYLPIVPVQYGRGCKFNCEFCSISAFYGKEQKFRCLQKVRAELIRKRVKYAFIIDDNLFMNEKKSYEII